MLPIETLEQGVKYVNIKDTRTTSLTFCSSIFIVNFMKLNAGWDMIHFMSHLKICYYRGPLLNYLINT